jgi:hypothetical protein
MSQYELLIEDDVADPGVAPQIGEVVQFGGAEWEIVSVESGGSECPRIRLVRRTAEAPDVEAHRVASVTPLGPPSSFESELVYTLTDLSTRLSSLAQVLRAYYAA